MRAAVLGRPIEHSLSPVLHRAAYRTLGLDWRYDAIDCAADELAPLLAGSGPEWAGFSCTMPVKRRALELAADAAPRASAVGAANTLLPADGGWRADNTDVVGIVGALAERRVRPEWVTVLGAGGTAQAVVVALAELGVLRCSVLVRERSRAGELLAAARRVGVHVELAALDASATELTADLVVSTLPAGAADGLASAHWSSGQVLLDAVYAPWPTPLAQAVGAAGGTVISGGCLLLHQAAGQVELMTGHRAPVAEMRAALQAAAPHTGV